MASLALMKRCAIVGLYVPCGTGTGLRVNNNHVRGLGEWLQCGGGMCCETQMKGSSEHTGILSRM
jgi:hypothetical protein